MRLKRRNNAKRPSLRVSKGNNAKYIAERHNVTPFCLLKLAISPVCVITPNKTSYDAFFCFITPFEAHNSALFCVITPFGTLNAVYIHIITLFSQTCYAFLKTR